MNEIELADRFETERPRLRGLALRMLGGEAAADDAVQEAWIRLVRTDQGGDEIDNLPGWLTTVAEYVGTPQKKSYDDAGFRRGRAMRFPEIPGEGMRNPDLHQIVEQWTSRDPSREPSIRSGTVGAARERSNTADTLQPPSPTYTRTSRDSLNPPTPSQVKHVGTSVRERMVGGEGGGLRSDIGVGSMREQSPPAIVVTSDPSSSS